ncbi:MAG: pentapeptide repeat-containing protein [Polyangiaceae bacterium]
MQCSLALLHEQQLRFVVVARQPGDLHAIQRVEGHVTPESTIESISPGGVVCRSARQTERSGAKRRSSLRRSSLRRSSLRRSSLRRSSLRRSSLRRSSLRRSSLRRSSLRRLEVAAFSHGKGCG